MSSVSKKCFALVLGMLVSAQAMAYVPGRAALQKLVKSVAADNAIRAAYLFRGLKNVDALGSESRAALSGAESLADFAKVMDNLSDNEAAAVLKYALKNGSDVFSKSAVEEAQGYLTQELKRTGQVADIALKNSEAPASSTTTTSVIRPTVNSDKEIALDRVDEFIKNEADYATVAEAKKMIPDLVEQQRLLKTTILSGGQEGEGKVCESLLKAAKEDKDFFPPLQGFVKKATDEAILVDSKCPALKPFALATAFFNHRLVNGTPASAAADLVAGCKPCGFCGAISANDAVIGRFAKNAEASAKGISLEKVRQEGVHCIR